MTAISAVATEAALGGDLKFSGYLKTAAATAGATAVRARESGPSRGPDLLDLAGNVLPPRRRWSAEGIARSASFRPVDCLQTIGLFFLVCRSSSHIVQRHLRSTTANKKRDPASFRRLLVPMRTIAIVAIRT